MTTEKVAAEISKHMPLEEFLRIQDRLAFLRGEEEQKLKALAELQQYYLAASTDQQRDNVKNAVAEIRELSRKTRSEIKELNQIVHQSMDLNLAKSLYSQYVSARRSQPEIASDPID